WTRSQPATPSYPSTACTASTRSSRRTKRWRPEAQPGNLSSQPEPSDRFGPLRIAITTLLDHQTGAGEVIEHPRDSARRERSTRRDIRHAQLMVGCLRKVHEHDVLRRRQVAVVVEVVVGHARNAELECPNRRQRCASRSS